MDIGDGGISEGAQSLSNGVLNGSVIINTSGALSPGPAQGVYGNLTINNALTVSNVVNMYVDHVAAGATSDSVTAQSMNIYGGATINVLQGANDLQAGDTFQLFNSSNPLNLNLASITLNLPKAGPVAHGIYAWDTSSLAANGTLRLASVSPPVTPVITWAAPAAISYGTALSASQLDATASVAGNYSYSPSLGTVLPAGTSTLSVVFTPSDTLHYTSATNTVSLVVSSVALTYVANPASRPYGAANPTFSGIVTGFVNGDTQASATDRHIGLYNYRNNVKPCGRLSDLWLRPDGQQLHLHAGAGQRHRADHHAPPGNGTWDGAGADNNWMTAANWAVGSINTPPVTGDALIFGGATRLTPSNNFPTATPSTV